MNRVLSGVALLLAVLSFAGDLVYLAGGSTVDVGGTAGRIVVGVGLLLGSAAMVLGLWGAYRSRRLRGLGMAAGAVFFGICFWWTVAAPVMAVAVAFQGIRGSRRPAQERVTAP